MRHVWSVLCTKASIDRESNNVSLTECLERIEVNVPTGTTFPVMMAFQADLVSFWVRDNLDTPEQGAMELAIQQPDGERSGAIESQIELNLTPRSRNVGHIQALRLTQPGLMEFVVSRRGPDGNSWEEVARVPLEVVFTYQESTENRPV